MANPSIREVILFIVLSSLILFVIFTDWKGNKEKQDIIVYLNKQIEERDQTIRVLRDSLALDSVLVISNWGVRIKPDSTGDSLIIMMGEIKVREWKRK